MSKTRKMISLGTALVLVVALVVSIFPFSAFADDAATGGANAPLHEITNGKAVIDGKEYIAITTAAELESMELGKNYILANDIDCSAVAVKEGYYLFNFPKSGDLFSRDATILNGNGFALTGIDFTSSATKAGVFNGVDNSGCGSITVCDLSIGTATQPAKITSTKDSNPSVGAFASTIQCTATLERVNVYATISVVDADAGGFFGCLRYQNDDMHTVTMTDCAFYGSITSSENLCDGNNHSGGMIGLVANSSAMGVTLTRCTNNGVFTGSTAYGGMIGRSSSIGNVTLVDCVNNADLTTVAHKWGSKLGGMIGQISTINKPISYSLSGCINNGDLVAPGKNAGGMIGEFTASPDSLTIEECRNYGTVTGSETSVGNYGGIIGLYYLLDKDCKLTISKTVNYGDIVGTYNVGGLIGSLQQPRSVEISQCANLGNVTAANGYAAGLCNSNKDSGLVSNKEMLVDGFLNAGAITSSADSAAGVFGYFKSEGTVTLTDVVNLGAVSAASGKTAANFVGESAGDVTSPAVDARYGGAAGLSDSSDMTLEAALTFLNAGTIGEKVGEFVLNEAKDQLSSTLSALEDEETSDPTPSDPTPSDPTPSDPTPSDPTPSDTETTTTEQGTSTSDASGDDSQKSGCSSVISFSCITALLLVGMGSTLVVRKKEN